jgi:hypothetical protein
MTFCVHIIIIIYFIWLESRSRLGRPRCWLWTELCVCGHNVVSLSSLKREWIVFGQNFRFVFGGLITLFQLFHTPCKVFKVWTNTITGHSRWGVRKNRDLSMSKNDDKLNEFIDEMTDGAWFWRFSSPLIHGVFGGERYSSPWNHQFWEHRSIQQLEKRMRQIRRAEYGNTSTW